MIADCITSSGAPLATGCAAFTTTISDRNVATTTLLRDHTDARVGDSATAFALALTLKEIAKMAMAPKALRVALEERRIGVPVG